MPPSKSPRQQPPRRRKKIALALLALFAALLAWGWGPLVAQAEVGTAYGASVACGCRHIDGRSLEDCRKDFLGGMGLVRLSEDKAAASVTASVPLIASTTSTFRKGWGCIMEPWSG